MGFKDDCKELLRPYYLVNIFLCFSYMMCKMIPPICNIVFAGRSDFDMKETEVLFFLLIVVMMRARKTGSMTMIAYLNNSFMYCKVANGVLWFLEFKPYGILFFVLFLVQALLFPQPTYKGPQNVVYFRDGKTLREELGKDKSNWLVEFFTAWNPACVNFAPVFAELSASYALDNLKFGKIDLGRNPEVGHDFRISDSSFSKQLPTLMLFKDGKVVNYQPKVDGSGRLIKFHMNKETIITTFDLNNLYKTCKEALKADKKQHIKAD